jgi:hypothetical protein
VTVSANCSGCGRRVELTEQGECPQGHLRSMFRDIREGGLPASQPLRSSSPRVAAGPRQRSSDPGDALAWVIGKSVVIVPVAAILAFGLWTGFAGATAQGGSAGEAALISVGSLAVTVGIAFAIASRRKRR